MVGQAPYRWEPHDHNRCSCVAQEVVLVGPSGQEFVNSSFALYPESSEVSATSLSEIDQQEARPKDVLKGSISLIVGRVAVTGVPWPVIAAILCTQLCHAHRRDGGH